MTFSKLIIFATMVEALPSLRTLRAKPCGPLYAFHDGYIVISGLGSVNGAIAAARFGIDAKEIWNAGLAGALNENFKVGDLFSVGSVTKHFCLPTDVSNHSMRVGENVFPERIVGEEPSRLISSDYPVYGTEFREAIQQRADLVDMEGYGVAAAAQALNKPCRLWKIVSDDAGDEGLTCLREHRSQLAEKIADSLLSWLYTTF